MIKHIVWDLDGTLFDTYPVFISVIQATMSEFGYTPDADLISRLARESLTGCLAILSETYGLAEGVVENKFGHRYGRIPYQQQRLQPGARALCEYITDLGGKNVIVTHRRRRSTNGLLDAHDLSKLVADSITGDDGYPDKPDPTSMLVIMTRNEIVAAEALAIGDRELDIIAGRGAGLRTCLLGTERVETEPDIHITELTQLQGTIQRENLAG
jgi:phosphoglycolate phosphatase-like HAD superfamily hydrolase